MENEYLLFSPSLLKTEVFHLKGIPCQKEEKRNNSAVTGALEPSQTSMFLCNVAWGDVAGKKIGTSAAPWTVVGSQCSERHPLETQAPSQTGTFQPLFFPNTLDITGKKLLENRTLTCQVATKRVGWLRFYFSVHGSSPLRICGSNSPLHQGIGQNPLSSRYEAYKANAHSGLMTKPRQTALPLKDHTGSWEGKDKDLFVREVSQVTGSCVAVQAGEGESISSSKHRNQKRL